MKQQTEIRSTEIKYEGNKAVGYAIVYNKDSDLLLDKKEPYTEIIMPGAVQNLNGDIRALYEHNPEHLLGKTGSGTLRLKEDPTGVQYEIDLPDTQKGKDVKELLSRKDISGASFRMFVQPGGDKWVRRAGKLVREIYKMMIDEISLVSTPVYPDTTAALRSLEAHNKAQQEKEKQEQDLTKLKMKLQQMKSEQ